MALLARADGQSKVSNYFQELFQRSRFALHQGAARQIDLTNCRGGAFQQRCQAGR